MNNRCGEHEMDNFARSGATIAAPRTSRGFASISPLGKLQQLFFRDVANLNEFQKSQFADILDEDEGRIDYLRKVYKNDPRILARLVPATISRSNLLSCVSNHGIGPSRNVNDTRWSKEFQWPSIVFEADKRVTLPVDGSKYSFGPGTVELSWEDFMRLANAAVSYGASSDVNVFSAALVGVLQTYPVSPKFLQELSDSTGVRTQGKEEIVASVPTLKIFNIYGSLTKPVDQYAGIFFYKNSAYKDMYATYASGRVVCPFCGREPKPGRPALPGVTRCDNCGEVLTVDSQPRQGYPVNIGRAAICIDKMASRLGTVASNLRSVGR